VIPCLYKGSCYSILYFLCSVLWSLVCIRVRFVQSHAFCAVFCDPVFVVGFELLNLMFSVQCFVISWL
jgi:TctA family transporter